MILLGHSLGGYLCACYAMKHPSRVQRLILASPVGLPPGDEARLIPIVELLWKWRVGPTALVKALGPFASPAVRRGIRYRGIPHESPLHEALFARYCLQVWSSRTSLQKALFWLLRPGAHPVLPLLHRLPDGLPPSVPLDLVYGDDDWMWDPAVLSLPALMPRHQLRIHHIPGGHQMYLEEPHHFNLCVYHLLSFHYSSQPFPASFADC